MNGHPNGGAITWKLIAVTLAGFLSAGVTGYFTFGIDKPTRNEVVDMIKNAPYPYPRERSEIRYRISELERRMQRCEESRR